MSYHRKRLAMGAVSTNFSGRLPRRLPALVLGSLGDDTLADPTLADPTAAWQTNVLNQLQAGVDTLKQAEFQKWVQIAATVSIPIMGLIWKKLAPSLFKKSSSTSNDLALI